MAAKGNKEKRQKLSDELNERCGWKDGDKKDFSKMDYEDLAEIIMIFQNKQKALKMMESVFTHLDLERTTQQELPSREQAPAAPAVQVQPQVQVPTQQQVQEQVPPQQQQAPPPVQGQTPPPQGFNLGNLSQRPFFNVLSQLGFKMEDIGSGENVKRGKRLVDDFGGATK